MKKRTLATLCGLLALLLAVCAIASCGGTPDTPQGTVAPSESDTSDPGGSYYPTSGDYEGRTFRVMQRADYPNEFDVKEIGTDDVDNAIWSRNTAIERAYNIFIEPKTYACRYDDTAMTDLLSNLYGAGQATETFDVIAGTQYMIVPTILNGWYKNLQDLNNFNIESETWVNGITTAMTVNGQTYAVTGDLSLAFWKGFGSMVFNKTWANRVWEENLYTVVSEGKWTFEYLKELALAASVNQGGDPTGSEQVYGFSSDWDCAIDGFLDAFNSPTVVQTGDGTYQFNMGSERMSKIVEKLQEFYKCSNNYTYAYKGTDPSYYFRAEDAMIVAMRFEMIERLKDFDGDYGILPYPMYEEGDGYRSPITDAPTLFLIPKIHAEPEFAATILSALAESSKATVIPEYYNKVIQKKSTKDPQSVQMLDLIRSTATEDFGHIHRLGASGIFRNTVNAVIWPANNDYLNFTSNWETAKPNAEARLQEFIDFYYNSKIASN